MGECGVPKLQPPAPTPPTLDRPPLAAPTGNLSFAPGACARLEPHLLSRIVGQEMALRQLSDAVCEHLAHPESTRPLVLSVHGPPGVGKSLSHLLAAQALYNRHIRPTLRCPGYDCAGYKARGGAGGRCCAGAALRHAQGGASGHVRASPHTTPPRLPQVLFGMDYTAEERGHQQAQLRGALLEHVKQAPESREGAGKRGGGGGMGQASGRAACRTLERLPPSLPSRAVVVVEEYDKLDCEMRGFFRQLLEHGQAANVSLGR